MWESQSKIVFTTYSDLFSESLSRHSINRNVGNRNGLNFFKFLWYVCDRDRQSPLPVPLMFIFHPLACRGSTKKKSQKYYLLTKIPIVEEVSPGKKS